MTETKKEETIVAGLLGQFSFLEGQVRIQRARRLWLETPADKFDAVFERLVDGLGFRILCAITGLDEGDSFAFIYHLAREDGTVVNMKTKILKTNAKWKSVGTKFPGGVIYEREIADLLGVQFEGLPPGLRYPLPDGWPEGQYPLRKDWQPAGGVEERKAGQ